MAITAADREEALSSRAVLLRTRLPCSGRPQDSALVLLRPWLCLENVLRNHECSLDAAMSMAMALQGSLF